MRKKTIICSAMLMLLAATALMFDSSATAATLKNDGTTVSDSTEKITISTDSEGRTVYKLTDDVTNGLELTLTENETAVLDGQGHTIHGTSGVGWGEMDPNTSSCGLSVSGSGTLIVENVTIIGGSNNQAFTPTQTGMIVSEEVNIKMSGSADIRIQGGGVIADPNATGGDDGIAGANGLEFSGNALIIEDGTSVTIEGSSGNDGKLGVDDAWWPTPPGNGGAAGQALSFSGNYLVMEGAASEMILKPGTPGHGAPNFGDYISSDGAAGYALKYEQGLVSTKLKDQPDFTTNLENYHTLSVNGIVNGTLGKKVLYSENYMTSLERITNLAQIPMPMMKNYQYLNAYTDFALTDLLESHSSIDLDCSIYLTYKMINMAVLNENSIVFDTQRIGYPSVSANTVTITSTGLENLDVTLVGADASCFELDKTGMAARLDKEDGTVTSTTFTVRPKDGLQPAGRGSRTYTADIKVTATDYEETCGTIRFTVNASNRFPVKIMNTSQVRIK